MNTFSLCMIVKNEENVLERCLDSYKDVFDEIVIVDTGSEDSTKAIAAKYTDRIYDFEWIDDFAAARNYAFSLCKCDYIFSADADEVLDEDNKRQLMLLKEHILPEIEIVQMYYVNRHGFMTTENKEKELRPKLFKRLRSFMWIDPIHESVNLNPVVYDSDIEILHMPERSHSKRDFSVFEKTIEKFMNKAEQDMPRLSAKLHDMYARELLLSGEKEDLEKASKYFEQSLNNADMTEEENMKSLCVLARNARLWEKDADFFKWSMKAVVLGSCSEICMELGIYYEAREDYDEAAVWYFNAFDQTKPVIDFRTSSILPYEKMSNLYRKMEMEYPDMREVYREEANKYDELIKKLK